MMVLLLLLLSRARCSPVSDTAGMLSKLSSRPCCCPAMLHMMKLHTRSCTDMSHMLMWLWRRRHLLLWWWWRHLLRLQIDGMLSVQCSGPCSESMSRGFSGNAIMLFHLQRHSDHHAHPTRRYQSLRHFDEAPELPTGYAGMIVLAYFPPLWYRVMDKRVVAHYDGDLRQANLQPGQRARLLAKYPPPATRGDAVA